MIFHSDDFSSLLSAPIKLLQEPCLIHSTCNACEIDGKSAECAAAIREQYEKNATALLNINKYGARLEYNCGVAKEFVMNRGAYACEVHVIAGNPPPIAAFNSNAD